jgi:predicted phage gp36 major capsid-like protein
VLVKDLSENVQNAMVSLYDLQTSLTNNAAIDPNAIRSAFSELRKQLREQWEDFRVYLQRCHAFGEDVSTLGDALETENIADCLEFLTDMADSAKELRSLNTKDVSATFQTVKDLQTSGAIC